MTTASPEPIPEYVIEALYIVHLYGDCNMRIIPAVRHFLRELGEPQALRWVEDHPDQYGAALAAMRAQKVAS